MTLSIANMNLRRSLTKEGLAPIAALFCVCVMFVALASGEDAMVPPVPSDSTYTDMAFNRHESRQNASSEVPDFLVGSHGTKSIRSIQFARPREAEQSAATRDPRIFSVHSTVNWVSPRAVHRSLFFNDNPLERDGKTNHPRLQPLVSMLRFTVDAVKFPVHKVADLQRGRPLHYATSPR